MYGVADGRHKACQEKGRFFSADSNFALPKKLRQCSVCSQFGLSTTPNFCNVCSQYGLIRKTDGPSLVARHSPDIADVPLFCKECSQYVLSSSPRFCIACSQHDGVQHGDERSFSDFQRLRYRDCFRNEAEYNKFLESCSSRDRDMDCEDIHHHDFSPKGHASGGNHVYEVFSGRNDRSPQSRGRNMDHQHHRHVDMRSSKSRGHGEQQQQQQQQAGYRGVQESVAKMVACYGAKTRRTGRTLSRAPSPRPYRFGITKTPVSMHVCADHGLTIPVTPCLSPCAAHGMALS